MINMKKWFRNYITQRCRRYSAAWADWANLHIVTRQIHQNVASNIEQDLEATPHKAPTIRPPASHHENYTS